MYVLMQYAEETGDTTKQGSIKVMTKRNDIIASKEYAKKVIELMRM